MLVENHRKGGRIDWSPPGGVVDEGEAPVEALTREVTEETGLVVEGWSAPMYRVEVEAPDLGWHLTVVCHLAEHWSGDIEFDDPDGIVRAAAWCGPDEVTSRMGGAPPWVAQPLTEWLAGDRGTSPALTVRFTAHGSSAASLEVKRAPW